MCDWPGGVLTQLRNAYGRLVRVYMCMLLRSYEVVTVPTIHNSGIQLEVSALCVEDIDRAQ